MLLTSNKISLPIDSCIDQAHHLTPEKSQGTWGTTSTSRQTSSAVFPRLSRQPESWERSSTTIRTPCRPAWSAVAGTLIRATKSILSIRQASSRKESGLWVAQALLLSGALSMRTSNLTSPDMKSLSLSKALFLSLSTETLHLEESSDCCTSLRTEFKETMFLTKSLKFFEIKM